MKRLFEEAGFWLLLLYLYGIIAWIVNLVKLIMCDFEGPWKEEIIHAVGVFIAPVSLVTCWF